MLEAFLVDVPEGMRCAFEFRDASWFNDEIYALLKAKNLALCIAESEKLATPEVATADYGYLRLRREDYQEADVVRWAEVVKAESLTNGRTRSCISSTKRAASARSWPCA